MLFLTSVLRLSLHRSRSLAVYRARADKQTFFTFVASEYPRERVESTRFHVKYAA
jgi:hypothetical protein